MSLLSDIKGFSRNKLHPTTTEITTISGCKMKETRDDHGHVITEVISEGELGFVGDYKPDLHVAEVMPGLCFGSQDVASNLDLLKSSQVTHIVNMAQLVDNVYPEHFQYYQIDILDLPESDILQHFDDAFEFINAGREAGCVYVHCNAGVSRAASLIIGYLMKTNRWDFQKAYDHVKTIRPAIRPNDGFKKQLESYSPT